MNMFTKKLFAVIMSAGLLVMTSCEKKPPVTVTTSPVTEFTSISATGGGTVVNEDAATISAKGVCWAITPNPTIASNKTDEGAGEGSFTSELTSLISNTLYYVRAYATVDGEAYYGNEVTFTTAASTELIVNGSFSSPTSGNEAIASAIPWKTDETTDEDNNGKLDFIGHAYDTYKGQTGYVWYFDWSKSLYQVVGMVPEGPTKYEISFKNTCTWNAWGDYVQVTAVIFSAYSGDDPTKRVSIDTVRFEEPLYPGWDQNTWLTKTGTYTLSAAKAAANAGKHLVIEFDALHYWDGEWASEVWYNIDDISVKQSSAK